MMIRLDLPDETKRHVEARASELGYRGVEEYVASLVAADIESPVSDEIEAELLRALKTPTREMKPADWDRKRRELVERHRQTEGG